VAPQAGTTVVPSVASPTATTQFGYNTAPAASQAYPNFNIDPAVIGTWDKAYGKGTGKSMADLLGQISGAQAPMIQSFLKDIQPMFQDNLNNILESFAAGGQRFSSGAALAAGKFGADFTSHQQTLMSQVMQWAFGSYMNALNGFKGANPSTPATDWIKFGLGMAGTAGSALQGAGFGGSAIDVLAGL
jgi:hypothetical protein